jgi:hypothetical protein
MTIDRSGQAYSGHVFNNSNQYQLKGMISGGVKIFSNGAKRPLASPGFPDFFYN